MPGVELKIVAIDDGDIATMDDAVVLGPGEIGEVVATSPHVSDRYYEAPNDMAANKIENGDRRWHRLGDCGFLRGPSPFPVVLRTGDQHPPRGRAQCPGWAAPRLRRWPGSRHVHPTSSRGA